MLPRELVELILDELDLESMCVLYDTNRFWRVNLTETDFQHKLQESCPWFEPQFSHRKTWRECSVEYVRRMRPKSRFTPKLRLLSDEHMFKGDFYNPQDDLHSPHDLVHIQCNHLRLLDDAYYTSEHGIEVDLSEMAAEYSDYVHDPEFDPQMECQVFSHPHMVIIIYMALSDRHFDHCDVVVKFKDGDCRKPDIKQHITVQGSPSVYTLGAHTFLFYTHSHCFYSSFTQPAAMYLFKDRYVVPIDIGLNDLRHAVVYDGLFAFFGKKKYYCLQANLNSSPARHSSWIKHLFRSTGSHRDPWWGTRYVMVMGSAKKYVFDVRKGILQKVHEQTFEASKRKFTWRDAIVIGTIFGSAVINWTVIYFAYRWFL